MTTSELRAMSSEALKTELDELLKEQFNLRMQHSIGQLENTAKLRDIKRNIARVKTIINANK